MTAPQPCPSGCGGTLNIWITDRYSSCSRCGHVFPIAPSVPDPTSAQIRVLLANEGRQLR